MPRVLQLIDRIIKDKEGEASGEVGARIAHAAPNGDDPWAADGRADDGIGGEERVAATSVQWTVVDGILDDGGSCGPRMTELRDEADAFLAGASLNAPGPLRLPAGGECGTGSNEDSPVASGGKAPRGRRPRAGALTSKAAHAQGKEDNDEDDGGSEGPAAERRILAQAPYYSGDPAVLARVAKAPLANLDDLVSALVPGAELVVDGLLLQLADEELVMLAYALEQVTEAASTRLIRDLEVRDELRSTCTHRREYLHLLDGALSQRG